MPIGSEKGVPNCTSFGECEIPLHLKGHSIGKVAMSGVCQTEPACEWMKEMISGLNQFEVKLIELLQESLPELFSEDPGSPGLELVNPLAKVS